VATHQVSNYFVALSVVTINRNGRRDVSLEQHVVKPPAPSTNITACGSARQRNNLQGTAQVEFISQPSAVTERSVLARWLEGCLCFESLILALARLLIIFNHFVRDRHYINHRLDSCHLKFRFVMLIIVTCFSPRHRFRGYCQFGIWPLSSPSSKLIQIIRQKYILWWILTTLLTFRVRKDSFLKIRTDSKDAQSLRLTPALVPVVKQLLVGLESAGISS
jgi:hypothetical protein